MDRRASRERARALVAGWPELDAEQIEALRALVAPITQHPRKETVRA